MSLHQLSLAQLTQGLASKQFSSQELTEHYLARIQRHDDKINSFITVTPELALAQAKAADEQIASGQASALTGIPIAHKDIFCTDGVKTSCGSKMLDNFIAPYESTVTQQCQQAGLVALGKVNMDEFAMGSSNESSFYGPAKNPWNLEHVPGGSSGGSAAAIAAGLAPLATGTDTGGSIRQPAAFCGISGIKPTYGRCSRFGMIAFASSLDQAGPMARSAEDLALLLNAMSGFDEKDSTSLNEPAPDFTAQLNQSLKGLRIGLPKPFFDERLNPTMGDVIAKAKDELEKLGATCVEVDLPHVRLSVQCYYIIAPAEASSNLSRFDGVRYGYRCDNPYDLQDLYFRSRSEGFGDEVKRRILIGTYALSAGFFDAYYVQAQKVRQLIRQDYLAAFEQCDIILGPTTPEPAYKLGEKSGDPVSMYLGDIYTLSANLAGLPAASIPCGFTEGLPVGLQLIAPYKQEAKLLNVAHQYQSVTDWHQQVAPGFEE
ncbi:MAG: Asp-tRNA(Asn)/Glu-tRNA(Gln) amidotransferase subunit GatA [Pseudomonadota bacterium]|nr:Asp-tRNA(Asn)/Glu-tRNA(Gln) amidotransferase subunit GatA [Pseudomonadota bacterium]